MCMCVCVCVCVHACLRMCAGEKQENMMDFSFEDFENEEEFASEW